MAFISTKYRPVFTGEAMPRLTTLYRAETLYTSMPRTMHRHEDVAEFILITEGSGIHIIDGQFLTQDVLPVQKTEELFPAFCHLLELMYRGAQGKGCHPEESINHLLCALLLLTMEVTSRSIVLPPEEHNLMDAVRSRLDASYDETITLAALAREFHISSFHLAHAFKAAYGYAPLQYITRRRIGEAQTLLIDTALPITEIAIRTGYNSSSYFNKAFHKITGMSPRDYRKAYRKI